jgi:hypothetical protein
MISPDGAAHIVLGVSQFPISTVRWLRSPSTALPRKILKSTGALTAQLGRRNADGALRLNSGAPLLAAVARRGRKVKPRLYLGKQSPLSAAGINLCPRIRDQARSPHQQHCGSTEYTRQAPLNCAPRCDSLPKSWTDFGALFKELSQFFIRHLRHFLPE